MMDLPLATATPSTGASTDGQAASRGGVPGGFSAALTEMLADAGQEVGEMVEALEALAELQGAERAELAAIGWPLPAFLALTGEGAGSVEGDPGDQPETTVDALLGQLVGTAGSGTTDTAETAESLQGAEAEDAPGASSPASDVAGSDHPDADGSTGSDAAVANAVAAAQGVRVEASGADARAVAVDDGEVPGGASRAEAAADAVTTRTATRGERASVEATSGADGARPLATAGIADGSSAEGGVDATPTLGGAETSRRAAEARQVGLPSMVQRILDAVERLENMPPPRQLTLELGEVRLRVGLEDGQLRLVLLGADSDAGDELLRDAREELAQRGFDLGGERDGRGQGDHEGRHRPEDLVGTVARARTRREPLGSLRL